MAQAARKKTPRKTLSITTEPKEAKAPATPTPEVEQDTDVRAVLDKIETCFGFIGTNEMPGTILPVAKNRNNALEAAEFVLADKLKKLAENRYKQAKEAASKAGIFGDENDYKEGDAVLVWNSPHYAVSMKVGKSSTMVDREKVEATLAKYLGHEKSQVAFEECLKERAGAKQVIVSMK
jgi:hypothetical protein